MSNLNPHTSHIGLLQGIEGPRRSARNQASGVKSTETTSSTHDESTGHQNRSSSQPGPVPSAINFTNRKTRTKWTQEEYAIIIKAYYTALKHPREGITKDTYNNWRDMVGNEVRTNIDANKLGTMRRDILKNSRLTTTQLTNIRTSVEQRPSETTEAEPKDTSTKHDEQTPTQDVVQAALYTELIRESESLPQLIEDTKTKELISEAKNEIIRVEAIVQNTDISLRKKLPKFRMNRDKAKMITIYNSALKEILASLTDISMSTLNSWIYSSALAFSEKLKLFPRMPTRRVNKREPRWKTKMDKCIKATT